MILYNNAFEIMTCTLCQSFSETCFVAGSVKKCIICTVNNVITSGKCLFLAKQC